MAAGGEEDIQVKPGTTVRVLTGARIPTGADAVVAEEYVIREDNEVLVQAFAEPKNVLRSWERRSASGNVSSEKGNRYPPAVTASLLWQDTAPSPVFRNPLVGIIGTGDELIEPGKPLRKANSMRAIS